MPTKPVKAKAVSELDTANVLNVTREEIGGTYADQVPVALAVGDKMANGAIATQSDVLQSLRGIGNVLTEFQPLANAFLSNLVNRIGRVIITSRLYENPWAGFKKGLLEYGETIEEIFVQLASPNQFDPVSAQTNVFKRRLPNVEVSFHTMNYQKFYPTTVSNDQLRQAFLSYQGVEDLIGRIIEQVYTGANYDEFLVMKYLIAQVALQRNIKAITIPTVTTDNARAVTTTMVSQAKKLGYMSKVYNQAGVMTYTEPSSLYMILTTDIESIFDVEVLALSFNMNKAELLGRQVPVDGFGTFDNDRLALIFADDPYTTFTPFTTQQLTLLSSIQGLMVDENWFMIFDNYYNMTEIYNPEGLYWNYFYHVWKTFSISPFSNSVLFTTEVNAITSVAVSPATATISKASIPETGSRKIQLTVTVNGTGFYNSKVTWNVNNLSAEVDENGLVTIYPDVSVGKFSVTATSVQDVTKTNKADITVTA